MRRGLLCGFTAALVCAAGAVAQTTGGIAGWISDASGAPLQGVRVDATGPNLQGQRRCTTAGDGTYRLPALPPGRYVVRASLAQFASVEKTVDVSVGTTAVVKVILQLAVSEQAFVSAATPFVDTTSTTTGTTYNTRVTIHLPLDRNYADVARDSPGVVEDRGEKQGRSLSLAVDGATSAESQWIIDGINTTNVYKGVQGKAVNNEFVEEVQVATGGFQAEYGRSLGGIINVITKSGGNAFHGGAFVYYDAASLRARRVFAEESDSSSSGMRLADYTRTDYGFDLGGFLLKDRLWFFGAYNRTELPAAVSRYVSSERVPSSLQFPIDGTDQLYSAKLTWNAAPGSTVIGTVFSDPTTNSGAGASDPRQTSFRFPQITNASPGTWEAERSIGATDYGLRVSQVFGSSAFLTVQAARHQDRYVLTPTGDGAQVRLTDRTCQGGNLLHPCDIPIEPNFVEGGFGDLGGPGNNSSSHRNQLRADTTLYRGPHDVKIGIDYQNAATNALALFSGGQQITRFDEYGATYYLHQFYAILPDWTPVSGSFSSSVRQVGAYVQDSWIAAPGLTINAGLRWDRQQLRDYTGVTRIPLNDEWQPRLGIAWDPSGRGTTRLYAFAGRFYHELATELIARNFAGILAPGYTYNFSPSDVAPDPNVIGHVSGENIGAPGQSASTVDKNLHGVSLDEFTVGAEKLIGSSLSVGVRATYRRLHTTIEDRCDTQNFLPGQNECAIVEPGSSEQFARGDFFYCTGLDQYDNCRQNPAVLLYGSEPVPPARRLYRGISLVARETFTDVLWLQASYVYSSLRGNYDGAVNEGFDGQTSPGINTDFDYPALFHNIYGRLYLDRPHDLRLSGFYRTPFRLSVGLEAYLLSGPPLDKTGYFNQQHPFHIQLVPRGYAGRMPTQWEASLTLEYPIRVGPVTATLQGYVFDVFNNQIPTSQDTVWSAQQPEGYPNTIFDANQKQTNPNYGKATSRQSPRLFRGAVRVSF